MPFLSDIFEVRTADDIDNFMNQLEVLRVTWENNQGQVNRYPYRISLAKDLLGLSDKNLDPGCPTNCSMTDAQPAQVRYQLFQQYLQQHVTAGSLKIHFTTSIQDNNIFSPNLWNNRISGVGLPGQCARHQRYRHQRRHAATRRYWHAGSPIDARRSVHVPEQQP